MADSEDDNSSQEFQQVETNKAGKTVFKWFTKLFETGSTLGTLGAGFTVSIVIAPLPEPTSGHFDALKVRKFAATSSLLFVCTVLLCQGGNLVFVFLESAVTNGVKDHKKRVLWLLAAVSFVFQASVLGAFMFFFLVIAGYIWNVGLAGIIIDSILALAALVSWALNLPLLGMLAPYFHWSDRLTSCNRRRSLANGKVDQEV